MKRPAAITTIAGIIAAIVILALVGLVLNSCLSSSAAGPAALPTIAPTSVPPTDTPSSTPSPAPSSTPSPTDTPMPSPLARIAIPDLKIDVPVEEMAWQNVQTANGTVTEWNIPENAAGHAAGSALPGQAGNIVISGHNNINGRVFMGLSAAWPASGFSAVDQYTDSSDVLKGKTIELYTVDGRRFDYTITHFYRLKEANVPLAQQLANGQYIAPTKDPQLTVTTCWPPWGNIDRLIVIAVPRS